MKDCAWLLYDSGGNPNHRIRAIMSSHQLLQMELWYVWRLHFYYNMTCSGQIHEHPDRLFFVVQPFNGSHWVATFEAQFAAATQWNKKANNHSDRPGLNLMRVRSACQQDQAGWVGKQFDSSDVVAATLLPAITSALVTLLMDMSLLFCIVFSRQPVVCQKIILLCVF